MSVQYPADASQKLTCPGVAMPELVETVAVIVATAPAGAEAIVPELVVTARSCRRGYFTLRGHNNTHREPQSDSNIG
jgi:hypothetical protein